jgi:hypothetical protein
MLQNKKNFLIIGIILAFLLIGAIEGISPNNSKLIAVSQYATIHFKNQGIFFQGLNNAWHFIPFFEMKEVLNNDSNYFKIDGQTFWIKVDENGDSGILTIRKDNEFGELIAMLSYESQELIQPIILEGSNGTSFEFIPMVDNSPEFSARVWFFLNQQVITVKHSKKLLFLGTDKTEDKIINANYFLPNNPLMPQQFFPEGFYNQENHFIAHFAIDEETDFENEIFAFIDTETLKLVDTNDSSLSNYEWEIFYSDNGIEWGLKENQFNVTEWGSPLTTKNKELFAYIWQG